MWYFKAKAAKFPSILNRKPLFPPLTRVLLFSPNRIGRGEVGGGVGDERGPISRTAAGN